MGPESLPPGWQSKVTSDLPKGSVGSKFIPFLLWLIVLPTSAHETFVNMWVLGWVPQAFSSTPTTKQFLRLQTDFLILGEPVTVASR